MPEFFAPCPRGLEALLRSDLETMGAQNLRATDGGVEFSGDWPLCYRVNLESRLASRVLWRVKETRYRTEQDVYDALGLEWIPSFGNFITIRVGRAAEIYKRLLKRGVIVRPVGGAYQLPEHLRVTIGTADENERFLAALAASIRE